MDRASHDWARMTNDREASRVAFESAVDLAGRVRRSRKTTIHNDRFSCLLVCICGRASLLDGEVEYPLFGGVCEGCGCSLPHVTIVTRKHGMELRDFVPTLAGQSGPVGRDAEAATDGSEQTSARALPDRDGNPA